MKKVYLAFIFLVAAQICRSHAMPDLFESDIADHMGKQKVEQQVTERFTDDIAVPFSNCNNFEKLNIHNKKAFYLLIFKTS